MAVPDFDADMDAWRKAVLSHLKNNPSTPSLLNLMTPRQQGKTFVWKQENSDGQHWQTRAPLHGGAAQAGSSGTAQRAGQPVTATQILQSMQAFYDAQYPEPAPLPREAPRLGEVTGWRAWRLYHLGPRKQCFAYLASLVRDTIWRPGEPMTGQPSDHGRDGVNAFKDKIKCELQTGYQPSAGVVVIGQVELWGEIVEHEHGYRAEYGYPLTLEQVIGDGTQMCGGQGAGMPGPWVDDTEPSGMLAELRRTYGLEAL